MEGLVAAVEADDADGLGWRGGDVGRRPGRQQRDQRQQFSAPGEGGILGMGANAIVNVRFATSNVASGASELFCYGTAVIVE